MNTLSRNALRAASAAFGTAATLAAVRAARRSRRRWRDEGRPEHRETTGSLVVTHRREDVYDLLRDPNHLTAALGPQVEIEQVGDMTVCWRQPSAAGPVAVTIELTGDVPDLLLAWRTADPPLPHEGTVRLTTTAGGTRIDVSLRYRWSASLARRAHVADDAVPVLLRRHLTALRDSEALSPRR